MTKKERIEKLEKYYSDIYIKILQKCSILVNNRGNVVFRVNGYPLFVYSKYRPNTIRLIYDLDYDEILKFRDITNTCKNSCNHNFLSDLFTSYTGLSIWFVENDYTKVNCKKIDIRLFE